MQLRDEINSFFSEVFNLIMKIEERALVHQSGHDLSITDLHIIEKIGDSTNVSMSVIASALNITLSTLTIAADKLEKKGYICRKRSEADRRVVTIELTHRGRAAYRVHRIFHRKMVDIALKDFNEDQENALYLALKNLKEYFEELIAEKNPAHRKI